MISKPVATSPKHGATYLKKIGYWCKLILLGSMSWSLKAVNGIFSSHLPDGRVYLYMVIAFILCTLPLGSNIHFSYITISRICWGNLTLLITTKTNIYNELIALFSLRYGGTGKYLLRLRSICNSPRHIDFIVMLNVEKNHPYFICCGCLRW